MQKNNKIKIVYILSHINKALAFEWIIDNLDKNKFELIFISIGCDENSFLETFCKTRNIIFYRIEYNGKKNLPAAILKTYKILRQIKPNAVHCHLFEANIIGLTAAYFAGIKKRIFTRHHSTFHHSTSPKGVKYDKYCNKLATHIVAISKNVEDILLKKEQVAPKKIYLIHHGFDLPIFKNISAERINTVALKYNKLNKHPVIGVVSRYTKWKGITYITEAFEHLLKEYPNALIIFANAKGDEPEIKAAIKKIPQAACTEIIFENDNAALFKVFDVFIHVPIDAEIEAFGQIYVEALAVGIPSVFTLSGIAREFITNRENALVVDYKNSEQIYLATKELIENKILCDTIIANGKKSVEQLFSLPLMIQQLEKLYLL